MNITDFIFHRYNDKYYFEQEQNDIVYEGEVVMAKGNFGKGEVSIYVSHIEPAITNETEATDRETAEIELLFQSNINTILEAPTI